MTDVREDVREYVLEGVGGIFRSGRNERNIAILIIMNIYGAFLKRSRAIRFEQKEYSRKIKT